MKAHSFRFSDIVDKIYNLPLDFKLELQNLLEQNIVEARRNEILKNSKKAEEAEKSGKLKFASKIQDLKKML